MLLVHHIGHGSPTYMKQLVKKVEGGWETTKREKKGKRGTRKQDKSVPDKYTDFRGRKVRETGPL
jgi:hypothetical protein